MVIMHALNIINVNEIVHIVNCYTAAEMEQNIGSCKKIDVSYVLSDIPGHTMS